MVQHVITFDETTHLVIVANSLTAQRYIGIILEDYIVPAAVDSGTEDYIVPAAVGSGTI